MSDTTSEIPAIIDIFDQFGELYNFKMNLHKSESLGINISKLQIEHLEQKYLFNWMPIHIIYSILA